MDDFPEIESASPNINNEEEIQNVQVGGNKDKGNKNKKKKRFADANIDLFKDIENSQKTIEMEKEVKSAEKKLVTTKKQNK
jgi:hypothetical protein